MPRYASDVKAQLDSAIQQKNLKIANENEKRRLELAYQNKVAENQALMNKINSIGEDISSATPEEYSALYDQIPEDYKQYFEPPAVYYRRPDVTSYFTEKEKVNDMNARIDAIAEQISTAPVEDYATNYANIPEDIRAQFPTPEQFYARPDIASYFTEKTNVERTNAEISSIWSDIQNAPVDEYASRYESIPANLKSYFPTPDSYNSLPEVVHYNQQVAENKSLTSAYNTIVDDMKVVSPEDYDDKYASIPSELKQYFETPDQFYARPEVKAYMNKVSENSTLKKQYDAVVTKFENVSIEDYESEYNKIDPKLKEYFQTPAQFRARPEVIKYYQDVQWQQLTNQEIDRLAKTLENVSASEYETKYNALPSDYKQYFSTPKEFRESAIVSRYFENVKLVEDTKTINKNIDEYAKRFDNATVESYDSIYNGLPDNYKQYFPTPDQYKSDPKVVAYYTGMLNPQEVNNKISSYLNDFGNVTSQEDYKAKYNALPTYYKQFFQTPTQYLNDPQIIKYFSDVQSSKATNDAVDRYAETLKNVTAEGYMIKYLNIPDQYKKYFQTPEQFKNSPQVVKYYADQKKKEIKTQYDSITNQMKSVPIENYEAEYNKIPNDLKQYFDTPTQFNKRPEVVAYYKKIADNPTLKSQYESYVNQFKNTPIESYAQKYNSLPAEWKKYFKTPTDYNNQPAIKDYLENHNKLWWKALHIAGETIGIFTGTANWLSGNGSSATPYTGKETGAFVSGLGEGFYAGSYGTGAMLGQARQKLGEVVTNIGNIAGQTIGMPIGIVNSFWGGKHEDITAPSSNTFLSGLRTGIDVGSTITPKLIKDVADVTGQTLAIPIGLANSFFGGTHTDVKANLNPFTKGIATGIYTGDIIGQRVASDVGKGIDIIKPIAISSIANALTIKTPTALSKEFVGNLGPSIDVKLGRFEPIVSKINTDLIIPVSKSLFRTAGETIGIIQGVGTSILGPKSEIGMPTNYTGNNQFFGGLSAGFGAGQEARLYKYAEIPTMIGNKVETTLGKIPLFNKEMEFQTSFEKRGTGIWDPTNNQFNPRIDLTTKGVSAAKTLGKISTGATYMIPVIGGTFAISSGIKNVAKPNATIGQRALGVAEIGLGIWGVKADISKIATREALKRGAQTQFIAEEVAGESASKIKVLAKTKIGDDLYVSAIRQGVVETGIPGITMGASRGVTTKVVASPWTAEIKNFGINTLNKAKMYVPYGSKISQAGTQVRTAVQKGFSKLYPTKLVEMNKYYTNASRLAVQKNVNKITGIVSKKVANIKSASDFYIKSAKLTANKRLGTNFNLLEGKVPVAKKVVEKIATTTGKTQPYQDVFISGTLGEARLVKPLKLAGARATQSTEAGQGVFSLIQPKGSNRLSTAGAFKPTAKEDIYSFLGGESPLIKRVITKEGIKTTLKVRPTIRGVIKRTAETGGDDVFNIAEGGSVSVKTGGSKVEKKIAEAVKKEAEEEAMDIKQLAVKRFKENAEAKAREEATSGAFNVNMVEGGGVLTQSMNQVAKLEAQAPEVQQAISGLVSTGRQQALSLAEAKLSSQARTSNILSGTRTTFGNVNINAPVSKTFTQTKVGYQQLSRSPFQVEYNAPKFAQQSFQVSSRNLSLGSTLVGAQEIGLLNVKDKQISRLGTQSLTMQRPKIQQLYKNEFGAIERVRQEPLVDTLQLSRVKSDVGLISRVRQESLLGVKEMQMSRVRQESAQRMRQGQASRMRTPSMKFNIKPPKLKFPPYASIKGDGFNTKKQTIPVRKQTGFDVQVKRRGMWVNQGVSLAESEAKKFAQLRLKQSLSASARLVPTRKALQRTKIGFVAKAGEFRQYQVKKGRKLYNPRLFIQNVGGKGKGFSRLGSMEEKMEIKRSKRKKGSLF